MQGDKEMQSTILLKKVKKPRPFIQLEIESGEPKLEAQAGHVVGWFAGIGIKTEGDNIKFLDEKSARKLAKWLLCAADWKEFTEEKEWQEQFLVNKKNA